jgi:hypothetical protein
MGGMIPMLLGSHNPLIFEVIRAIFPDEGTKTGFMESRPPRGQIRLLDAYPTSCRYAIDAKRPLHVCHHASDLSQGQWPRSRQSAEPIAASRVSGTFSQVLQV